MFGVEGGGERKKYGKNTIQQGLYFYKTLNFIVQAEVVSVEVFEFWLYRVF